MVLRDADRRVADFGVNSAPPSVVSRRRSSSWQLAFGVMVEDGALSELFFLSLSSSLVAGSEEPSRVVGERGEPAVVVAAEDGGS